MSARNDTVVVLAVRDALSAAGCPFPEVVDLVLSRHPEIDADDRGTVDAAVSAYQRDHPGFFATSDKTSGNAPTVDFRDRTKPLGQLEDDLKATVADRKPNWQTGIDFHDRSRPLAELEREHLKRARMGVTK